MERHRCGFRGRLRSRPGKHDPGIVKNHIPGGFIHHAGGFQSVLGLGGFHRPGGVFLEIAADGSFVIAQLGQPLLHGFHQLAGRAALQLLFKYNIRDSNAVLIVIHQVIGQVGRRCGGVVRFLALAQDSAFSQHILQVRVGYAVHFQVILFLQGFHGLPGRFQVVSADLSLVVSQLCQLLLQVLDVIARGAVAQGPVIQGKQNGQGPQIGHAGLVQVKVSLESFHCFPGPFPVSAGQVAGIVLQFLQPCLQRCHVFAVIPELKDPSLEDFLLRVQFFILHHVHRLGIGIVPFLAFNRHGIGVVSLLLCQGKCAGRKQQDQSCQQDQKPFHPDHLGNQRRPPHFYFGVS